jgi:hypothetical protein
MSYISFPTRRRFAISLPTSINWQWVVIVLLSLVVLWDNRGVAGFFWTDVPEIRDGHRNRTDVCSAEADGFTAAGNVIAAGGTVEAALAALQTTATTARQAAFFQKYSGPFSALVPAGTEPKDAATRAAYAQKFFDHAAGLRWWWPL